MTYWDYVLNVLVVVGSFQIIGALIGVVPLAVVSWGDGDSEAGKWWALFGLSLVICVFSASGWAYRSAEGFFG